MEHNLKIILIDIQTIKERLENVIKVETNHISMLRNPESPVKELYQNNINWAKESINHLSFLQENLPKIDINFNEMKTNWYEPRKIQSLSEITKYRTQLDIAKNKLESYVRSAKMDPNGVLIELKMECVERIKLARKALINIKLL